MDSLVELLTFILCSSKTPETVTVRAESEDDVCGLVAIHPLQCPFADSVSPKLDNMVGK